MDSLSEMDPYDREERCRKTIRILLRAVILRIAAVILLAAAVIRSGSGPLPLALSGFAVLIVVAGTLPLCVELRKQYRMLKESMAQQEKTLDSE